VRLTDGVVSSVHLLVIETYYPHIFIYQYFTLCVSSAMAVNALCKQLSVSVRECVIWCQAWVVEWCSPFVPFVPFVPMCQTWVVEWCSHRKHRKCDKCDICQAWVVEWCSHRTCER